MAPRGAPGGLATMLLAPAAESAEPPLANITLSDEFVRVASR